jgi:hypothetical protein
MEKSIPLFHPSDFCILSSVKKTRKNAFSAMSIITQLHKWDAPLCAVRDFDSRQNFHYIFLNLSSKFGICVVTD